MYKNLLLIGAVLFGCMCSSVFGEYMFGKYMTVKPPQVSVINPVQSLADFDITPEVNELRQAKAVRDDAIRRGDVQKIAIAQQTFENVKTQCLEKIKGRRRRQYDQVRILATCEGINKARLGCPYAGLHIVPGSGWVARSCEYYETSEPHYENNEISANYTNYRPLVGDDSKTHLRLSALYAYDECKLIQLVNKDMSVLKLILEAAL